MLSKELVAEVRRLYYAEHWKVGTITSELGLHHTTVRRALGLLERCGSRQAPDHQDAALRRVH